MTFTFDTGFAHPDIAAAAAGIDEGQRVVIRDHKRARALFSKIKQNIEANEDQDALDAYMAREDLILDALHLFDPHVTEELREIYETHRACLVHGGVNRISDADPRRTDSGNAQDAREAKTATQGEDNDWF